MSNEREGGLAGRRWLTVNEYGAATYQLPNTVRKQLREGRLHGRRFKGGWRVLASELTRRPIGRRCGRA